MAESRVKKSLMNVRVNLFFYLLSFLFAFVSRKVFLDALSDEFVGLTGTFGEILGLLMLAEMGISTSISYFLYKPLKDGSCEQINEIMSLMGFLYRRIGVFIGLAAILISISFPWMFGDSQLPLPFIYYTFGIFVGGTLLNFFFNYKQILLVADQRNYVVSAYTQTLSYVKSAIQILLAYYYRDLYLWVLVELVFTLLTCVTINYRVKTAYPWLHIVAGSGRELIKAYPDVLRKTRQVFIHNLKNFALRGSDQIFIFAFVSLKMVAYYSNYTMLLNKVNVLVNVLSDGMNAGVGNLVAEGNIRNTMKVFWELSAIRFLFTGVIVFGFLCFTQPFITYWIGAHYLLNDWMLYLMIFSVFIMLSRGTVEMYLAAYGLFADVWAAWTELALNLGITIVGGYFFGIWGILLAKVISVFFIAMFWKPYYLFRDGFRQSVSVYWRGMSRYYTLFAFSLVAVWPMRLFIHAYVHNMLELIVVAALGTALYLVVYFLLLYCFTNGMKYFAARFQIKQLFRKF